MSQKNNGDWIVPVSLILVGLGAFAVWKFSQFFGLDFQTGFEVLKRLVPIIIAWACLWYFLSISFRDTWPIAIASVWFSWWPALDYWSSHSLPEGFVNYGIAEPVWYAMWYTKLGVLAAIVGIGYAIRSWLSDN